MGGHCLWCAACCNSSANGSLRCSRRPFTRSVVLHTGPRTHMCRHTCTLAHANSFSSQSSASKRSCCIRAGTFRLTLEFSEDYPNKAPVVKFKSQMYHPNSESGVRTKEDRDGLPCFHALSFFFFAAHAANSKYFVAVLCIARARAKVVSSAKQRPMSALDCRMLRKSEGLSLHLLKRAASYMK